MFGRFLHLFADSWKFLRSCLFFGRFWEVVLTHFDLFGWFLVGVWKVFDKFLQVFRKLLEGFWPFFACCLPCFWKFLPGVC